MFCGARLVKDKLECKICSLCSDYAVGRSSNRRYLCKKHQRCLFPRLVRISHAMISAACVPLFVGQAFPPLLSLGWHVRLELETWKAKHWHPTVCNAKQQGSLYEEAHANFQGNSYIALCCKWVDADFSLSWSLLHLVEFHRPCLLGLRSILDKGKSAVVNKMHRNTPPPCKIWPAVELAVLSSLAFFATCFAQYVLVRHGH